MKNTREAENINFAQTNKNFPLYCASGCTFWSPDAVMGCVKARDNVKLQIWN